MTPREITAIADKALSSWFAEDPATSKLTLRSFVEGAITEALERQAAEYADGTAKLRHERDKALDQLSDMRLIAAAHGAQI